MKGKRMRVKQTGQTGICQKVCNGCLWVLLDDGKTTISGHKRFFAVVREGKK